MAEEFVGGAQFGEFVKRIDERFYHVDGRFNQVEEEFGHVNELAEQRYGSAQPAVG